MKNFANRCIRKARAIVSDAKDDARSLSFKSMRIDEQCPSYPKWKDKNPGNEQNVQVSMYEYSDGKAHFYISNNSHDVNKRDSVSILFKSYDDLMKNKNKVVREVSNFYNKIHGKEDKGSANKVDNDAMPDYGPFDGGVTNRLFRKEWLESKKGKYNARTKSLDFQGDVDVDDSSIIVNGKFAIRFGTVGGDFKCAYMRLSSLAGGPKRVGGDFDCSGNSSHRWTVLQNTSAARSIASTTTT